jgi:hypothetical protein
MKKIILINSAIVISVIILLEISVKILFDVQVQGVSSNIINEDSVYPRFNNKNISNGKVFGKEVFTNNDGYRTNKFLNKKNKNNIPEVYFIGGSVTFGMGVDQKDSFSGILNHDNSSLSIFNSSTIGSNLENNYYILKNKIKKNNLKNVFINFSLDDIRSTDLINFENTKHLEKNKGTLNALKNITLFREINKIIRNKSRTYVLFKNYFFNAKERYYVEALNLYDEKKNLINMKNYLDKIQEIDKKIENKIVFMIIPYSNQILQKNCKNYDKAETLIKNELERRNFKYINFKKEFCSVKNSQKYFLSFDPSHLSKNGHSLIAKIIKEKFL